jgi:hypothetical protein
MIVTFDEKKYGALLAATRPGVITDDAGDRLTAEVNRLVSKGIKLSKTMNTATTRCTR